MTVTLTEDQRAELLASNVSRDTVEAVLALVDTQARHVAALRAGLLAADSLHKYDANGAGAVWDDVLADTAAAAAQFVDVDGEDGKALIRLAFNMIVDGCTSYVAIVEAFKAKQAAR